ncbi:MAG: TIGR01777 family oxidoreductase [Bdellovibrionales bacterium]|nr:TIGR01777 family oxidoreductase [Bdellovibrionales bacterium]
MKILLTGATGLVGTKLLEQLTLQGFDDLRILSRNKQKAKSTISFPAEIFEWNPEAGSIDKGALENVDIIIHLAGENIADGSWSKDKKERIMNSRTMSSLLLMKEIKKLNTAPKKFISSSAVGIYGSNNSSEIFNEESKTGSDYLAEVCKAWESNIFSEEVPGMKVHAIRTGVVLSNEGGALQKMLPAFLMGVAGKLGSGSQYMSWIHIDDLVNQFIFLIKNDGKSKIYNGVSNNPVTNNTFTKILGKTIARPTLFPVPGIILKVIFGEMSDVLLKGQKVLPVHFVSEGFKFQYPTLENALQDLLKYSNRGEVVFKKFLWIEKSTPEVFLFFSDEKNLEKITPPYLGFKIKQMSTAEIMEGSLIDYNLKIHGVPAKWRTKISTYVKDKTFTDEQLIGPYKKWVHTHDFTSFKNGTLMKDQVVYKLPLGLLGRLVAGKFVKKDVENIFKYRNEVITNNFL